MDTTNDKDKNEDGSLANALETVVRKEDITDVAVNSALDESLKKNQKNPLLFGPVIKCMLKFLNINDIKNCRLVAWEWGSIGKVELAKRSKIRFITTVPGRRPVDFKSFFLDSTALFGAFEIRFSTAFEELTKFFDEHQQYLKELTFQTGDLDDKIVKNIDIGRWIAKSPMVKMDAKHMTKLSLKGFGYGKLLEIPPIHLIAHVKDLTLSDCKINIDVESGIRICPIKLTLSNAKFLQDGFKLDHVQLLEIVDLRRAKEVSLLTDHVPVDNYTIYNVDLLGSVTLDSLTLDVCCEIVSGETSQWEIEHLSMNFILCSLNSQMNIKELSLSHATPIDLATLPSNTIQKLALYVGKGILSIRCTELVAFPNLQYLHIVGSGKRLGTATNCSFLSHFANSPKLMFLKFNRCGNMEMKSLWMPTTVETLTLEYSTINWLDNSYLKLEKLVYHGRCTSTNELSTAKILVDDFDMVIHHSDLTVNKSLVDILEYRKNFAFVKPLYIGKLRWDRENLQDSLLNGYVDVKSLFYVFENGEKGRPLSENEFLELVPEHIDLQEDEF